jgi:hypothetical protein
MRFFIDGSLYDISWKHTLPNTKNCGGKTACIVMQLDMKDTTGRSWRIVAASSTHLHPDDRFVKDTGRMASLEKVAEPLNRYLSGTKTPLGTDWNVTDLRRLLFKHYFDRKERA